MDSSKDSEPRKNTVKLDDGGERDKNYKSVPTQSGATDNAENLFTTSNQSSSFLPLIGPRAHMTPTSDNQQRQRANKSGENSSETYKNSSITQSQMCNKVTNNNTNQAEHATAGGSGSVANAQDNGTDTSQDIQSCQRHKICIDKAGSINIPSTSGISKATDNPEGGSFRESRKRPSSLKLNRPSLDEDSSSDTGTEDYSLGSEDGCIYTYRGGEHLADLPSSFFSLDMGLPLDNHLPLLTYPVPLRNAGRDQGSRASSPDMEFLEMDFDPGPSCEVDTGDESSPDVELEAVSIMPEEHEPVLRAPSPEQIPPPPPPPREDPVNIPANTSSGSHGDTDVYTYSVQSTSRGVIMGHGDASESHRNYSYGPYITHVNTRGEQLLVRRTMACGPASLHVPSGDTVSPREMLDCDEDYLEESHQGERLSLDSANILSAFYHMTMVKKLMAEKKRFDSEAQSTAKPVAGSAGGVAGGSSSGAGCAEPPRSMVWSECEACERQVTQIGFSASGATAVVNIFIALGVPVNLEKINSAVGTRTRAHNAPLPRYLLSRSIAGCTSEELVTGIHRASDGLVTARFFPTYPERAVSLSHWLADWITLGAVPMLTLNPQAGCGGDIPDSWQHQMVFGVSPRGVYLCNPVACVREAALWPQLSSPSVLLVQARNILSRFNATTDLTTLMAVPDRRFHTFNVLGQVANVIRESRALGWGSHGTRTRYVRLPAAHRAGVTVAALVGSPAHRRLVAAPDLPLLAPAQPDPGPGDAH